LDLQVRIYGSLLILSFLLINTLYSQDRKFYPIPDTSPSKIAPNVNPSFSDTYAAPDKAQHFMGSMISTVLFYKIFQDPLQIENSNSKYLAVGITLGLGVSKEIYDGTRSKGAFSWKDLLADMAGIAAGLILVNQP